jgi:hypothetical protein
MYAMTVPTIFIILCQTNCPLAEGTEKRQRCEGKLETEAELAFFSRHLGFVNNNRVQGQLFYDILRMYVELKSGKFMRKVSQFTVSTYSHSYRLCCCIEHEIQCKDVPRNMLEKLSALMKAELCRKYLNESLLRYNNIFFDEEASLEMLSVVEMAIEFEHHDVPTILDKFIRCPITSESKAVGYLYMTLVEKAKFEKEEHYYIFVEEKPGFVVPFMRSRYNYGSLLNNISTSLRSYARNFADTILSMGENFE